MSSDRNLPRISSVFDSASDTPHGFLYSGSIRSALRRLLPQEFSLLESHREEIGSEGVVVMEEKLPLIKWSQWEGMPYNVSISLLCLQRANAGKFFYEMISRWLIPGRQLHVASFFFTDFTLPDLSDLRFTLSEIVISLQHEQDLELVRTFLPVIESEICMGIVSVYHANRILEIKGLTADEKTAFVQEHIARLIQSKPAYFDYDIFHQMQHFLVMCSEEFKALRDWRHMSRIICIFYLFRKALHKAIEKEPDKRILSLKLMQARLQVPLGVKEVLSVFVGMNFLNENEVFEDRHLLKALQTYLPALQINPGSVFTINSREDKIMVLYLEVEKEGWEKFSPDEIKRLREVLPRELKERVEKLQRPLFMPRNEEEVMRNILTLSQQLKYPKDLPQVIISFEEQTDTELSFTVILLRVLLSQSRSVQEMFETTSSRLKYIPDRTKHVAWLRKKYPKEASVFRVRLSNSQFLRDDHSVDLFKTRQSVVVELQKIIGEFRDYNGGMIAKQMESMSSLREMILETLDLRTELFLENFFHSIYPIEWRSIAAPAALKGLFDLFVAANETFEKKRFAYLCKAEAIYLMLTVSDKLCKDRLDEALASLHLSSSELVTLFFEGNEIFFIGYIFFTTDPNIQQVFFNTVKEIFEGSELALDF